MSDGKLQPWAVSIFGVLTIIIGALIGHFLSVREKRASLLDDAQRQAYMQVLDQIEEPTDLVLLEADMKRIESEAVKSEGSSETKKAHKLRASLDALTKRHSEKYARWVREWKVAVNEVAIYGDSAVVRALAEFDRREHRHPDLCNKDWALDVEIYQTMRRSLIPGDQAASDKDLADLVMQCTAPN